MIAYLEGKLLQKEADKIILLTHQIGYEIHLPTIIYETLKYKNKGDDVSLYIYYYQTERQPKPVLIGFNFEAEKEFFQQFINVEDIGPMKAVKALTLPISDIARAIENKDEPALKRLKGIGPRTARKIIATLSGKMEKFALISKVDGGNEPVSEDFTVYVFDVLVTQLGHKINEAKRMIKDAMERNPDIKTPEALLEEVYRGEAGK